MLIIKEIEKDSIGAELKFKKGDAILKFDNFEVVDYLDYLYYNEKENFSITLKRKNGKIQIFDIEKDDDETLGLDFENYNLDIRTCHNHCIFCFIDQMPPNMRQSLYVKDDDYRQSFLCGNFVTLTNAKMEDIKRIVRLNLSPLYVSVHSMNREIRCKMTNNRFAGNIVDYIDYLAKNNIKINTQIVLVKGVNDGEELEYSARELFKYYPNVESMAVVPCGITKYRDGLTKIDDITKDYALSVINLARKLNEEFKVNFVQLGDEFYFKAQMDVEPYEFYGNFTQIENGVGTTAKFKKEILENLIDSENNKKFLAICGVSASNFIKSMARLIETHVKGLKIEVLAVENKFFGSTINCTGLLTGKDILNAVKEYKENFDVLVIPSNTLKEFEEIFLDDMTVDYLKEQINKPIRITNGTGQSFVETFTK